MTERLLIQLEEGFVNPVLITNAENSVLVDTGRRRYGNHILRQIEKYTGKPDNIKLIILTHTHFDHAGNARFLKERTGAKVVVHRNEVEYLEKGFTPIPLGTSSLAKKLSWAGRNLVPFIGKYPSVKPDIIVDEKFSLSPWNIDGYVLHTPGHTEGSQSVILGNTILAGDMFFNRGIKGVFPPFADDPELLLKSWERIFDLGIEIIYPGHGAKIAINRAKETYLSEKSRYLSLERDSKSPS